MRIIVISDTHGRTRNLRKLLQKQQGADLFIHLGDGIDDVESIRELNHTSNFVFVKGNVDFSSNEPLEKLLVLEEKRIFLSHGHKLNVKRGYSDFVAEAKNQNADIALFGHTHTAYINYKENIHFMNPGSLERPTDGKSRFGIIDIFDGMITIYLSSV